MFVGDDLFGLGKLKGLRAITTSRVSHLTANTHSDERQEETCEDFVQRNSMIHLGYCEDLNISGAMRPEDRPQLGPWLRGEKGEFDAIIFTTVDRISRSVSDFLNLRAWCKEHNKKLICVVLGMDLASDAMIPKVLGMLMAMFGEIERDGIKGRVAGGRTSTKAKAGVIGGKFPYWLDVVPHASGKGFEYALNKERSALMMEIIERVEAKDSYTSIAEDMNARGLPTPMAARSPEGKVAKGESKRRTTGRWAGKWCANTVKQVLRSRMLCGQFEEKEYIRKEGAPRRDWVATGRTVVLSDDEGNHIEYCKPLITEARWHALQAILDKKRSTAPTTKDPLGIVFCVCGERRYRTRSGETFHGSKYYEYYRCNSTLNTNGEKPNCGNKAVRADGVDTMVAEEFLTLMGSREVCTPIHHPAQSATLELDEIREEYDRLFELLLNAPGHMKDKYAPRKAALEARIEELEAQPQIPAWTEYIPQGKTVRELWNGNTWEANCDWLRKLGVTITTDGAHTWHVNYPHEIDDMLKLMSGVSPQGEKI